MTRRTCVLVTGVGGRSVGHQILHALQLRGDKYRIVVTDSDAFSFGLYQANTRYVVPQADDSDYIPALLRIVAREGVEVIIPGTEPEVRAAAQHRAELAAAGCTLIANPDPVVKLCSNKWRLYEWLAGNGISVPRTVPVEGWRTLVEEGGFPIVGKPTEATGGSRNVALLEDEIEVMRYLAETKHLEGQVIFQEYVGEGKEEYTVGVLVAKGGAVIDSLVVHRKLVGLSLGTSRVVGGRTYALSTGYSQGFIIKHAPVQRYCEDLAVKLGIRGPANIQCRLSGEEVKVFEVHPRFSGTTSIRAEVGFNEPDVLIRNFLAGESFERLDYRADVAAIRAFRHVIVPLSEMRAVTRI